jgi:hypothetical protein
VSNRTPEGTQENDRTLNLKEGNRKTGLVSIRTPNRGERKTELKVLDERKTTPNLEERKTGVVSNRTLNLKTGLISNRILNLREAKTGLLSSNRSLNLEKGESVRTPSSETDRNLKTKKEVCGNKRIDNGAGARDVPAEPLGDQEEEVVVLIEECVGGWEELEEGEVTDSSEDEDAHSALVCLDDLTNHLDKGVGWELPRERDCAGNGADSTRRRSHGEKPRRCSSHTSRDLRPESREHARGSRHKEDTMSRRRHTTHGVGEEHRSSRHRHRHRSRSPHHTHRRHHSRTPDSSRQSHHYTGRPRSRGSPL